MKKIERPGGSLQEKKEIYEPPLEEIGRALGFTESSEMHALRIEASERLKRGEEIREVMTQYNTHADERIEKRYPKDGSPLEYREAQIGYVVMRALMWVEGGKVELALEEVRDAILMAQQEDYYDADDFRDVADLLLVLWNKYTKILEGKNE